ncbi:MAG: tetratricopeptide repeat protein [Sandaracinaceae bacterium]|nr:tetratricopeptide repeat protein [Sandaracinaceae bacterium]
MRRALPILVLWLVASSAHADSIPEIFERANASFFRGDHDAAAAGYRRLIELGVVDRDLAFNLATAEAKRGRYGEAIRYYEQALYLDPGDGEARDALSAARSALARRRAEAHGRGEVASTEPLADALLGGVSTNALVAVTLGLEVLFFGALASLLFVKRESARLAAAIASPLLGVALIGVALGLTVRMGWYDEGAPAVVLTEHGELREGPDPRAAVRHRALEGQRAWVLDESQGFYRVQVPEVGQGWMSERDVGVVRPHARLAR